MELFQQLTDVTGTLSRRLWGNPRPCWHVLGTGSCDCLILVR